MTPVSLIQILATARFVCQFAAPTSPPECLDIGPVPLALPTESPANHCLASATVYLRRPHYNSAPATPLAGPDPPPHFPRGEARRAPVIKPRFAHGHSTREFSSLPPPSVRFYKHCSPLRDDPCSPGSIPTSNGWFLYWAPTALGPHCHGNRQRPALRHGPPYRSPRLSYGHVPYRLITLRAQPRLRYLRSRRTQSTGLTRTSCKTVQAPLSRERTPHLALPSARGPGPNLHGTAQIRTAPHKRPLYL